MEHWRLFEKRVVVFIRKFRKKNRIFRINIAPRELAFSRRMFRTVQHTLIMIRSVNVSFEETNGFAGNRMWLLWMYILYTYRYEMKY